MRPGDIILGKVVALKPYGAFVECGEYTGLIHISKIGNKFIENIGEYLEVGASYKLRVLAVDETEKKLELSFKRLNKIRGKKGEVPKYLLGFKTVQDHFHELFTAELERMSADETTETES